MSQDKLILIVDDDPDIRQMLADVLMDEGYSTLAAEDGQVALSLVDDSPPDLILLDLMMPRLNGWQVLSELQARPEKRDIPIILLSAVPDLGKIARQTHVCSYLPKPFDLHATLAQVEHCLQ